MLLPMAEKNLEEVQEETSAIVEPVVVDLGVLQDFEVEDAKNSFLMILVRSHI